MIQPHRLYIIARMINSETIGKLLTKEEEIRNEEKSSSTTKFAPNSSGVDSTNTSDE